MSSMKYPIMKLSKTAGAIKNQLVNQINVINYLEPNKNEDKS